MFSLCVEMRYTLGGRGFHEKEICLMDAVFSTLYLSAFTFGGGYVIVSLMKKKFVDEYHWIEEDEMLDLIAIAQSAPGAIAVNGAIVVGYKLAGLPGVLLLVNAFWDGGPVTLAETNWTMLLLFAGCLLLLRKTKLSPILIMVLAGVINVVKAVLAG